VFGCVRRTAVLV